MRGQTEGRGDGGPLDGLRVGETEVALAVV